MPLSLPTQPTAPTQNDPQILTIYGPPKVGKTTALSQIKNSLIIDTEKGTRRLTATKLEITSLMELKEAATLIKNANKPYKTVIIDTIDLIEEWCESDATIKYKASVAGKNFFGNSVLELPQGYGYRWLRDSFHQQLSLIKSLADRIVFVGHVRDKLLDVAGKEVAAKDLDLTGKIRTIICSMSDAIGYIYRGADGSLNITFKTSATTISVGSRCQHLIGYDGPLDWSKIYIDKI